MAVLRVPQVWWAALSALLFAAGAVLQSPGAPVTPYWLLYLACYATGGWEPGLAAVRAARAKSVNVDQLMVVAALVTAVIGQPFDGALLIVVFATSGALAEVATRQTADSVRALFDLAPEQVTRLDDAGREERIDAAAAAVGDRFVSVPGRGVTATVNGRAVRVVSPGWIGEDRTAAGLVLAQGWIDAIEDAGGRRSSSVVDDVLSGVLGLIDRVRSDARAAVAALTAAASRPPVLRPRRPERLARRGRPGPASLPRRQRQPRDRRRRDGQPLRLGSGRPSAPGRRRRRTRGVHRHRRVQRPAPATQLSLARRAGHLTGYTSTRSAPPAWKQSAASAGAFLGQRGCRLRGCREVAPRSAGSFVNAWAATSFVSRWWLSRWCG
jgi:hypothetical protein